MTTQGSPHARFKRALASRNPTLVVAAASEMGGRLTLADALAVTLVFLPQETERYERASIRWHARWCLEARPRSDEAALALAALQALPGTARQAAAEALIELLEARGLDDAAQVLSNWAGAT
jgi:hypothetical protein